MTAEKDTRSADRRKRVRLLKRLIILSLVTSVLVPIVLCIILFIRLQSLEERIEELNALVSAAYETSGGTVLMEANGAPPAEAGNTEAGAGDRADAEDTLVPEGEEDTPAPAAVQSADAKGAVPGGTPAVPGYGRSAEDAAYEEEPVRKVYLTFDDGPSSGTDEILDILAEYDVKATFFVVGKDGEWAQEAYRRIVAEGHTLGMHSYTHEYSTIYASVDAYREDLTALQEYLYEVTGTACRFVRFPGGSSNQVSQVDMTELISWLDGEGYVYFDWNVSSQDASSRQLDAEEIVENCLEGIEKHGNAVVLMHDAAGRHTTVEALPALIEAIQAMDSTVLLPITEDTIPVQHITITQKEETED